MGIDSILRQHMQNAGIAGINRLAGNAMYPQSQQVNTQFATPSQMPTSAEVLRSDYDAVTNPYTGEPIRGFNDGGGVENPEQLDSSTEPVDYKAKIDQLYQGILGRSPDADAKGWENLLLAGYDMSEVGRQIGASSEAQKKALANISPEIRKNDPNNFAGTITELYASALGRTPDPESLEADINLLNRNPDAFAWLADTVTKSPEAQAYAEKSGVDLQKAYDNNLVNYKHFTPTPKQGGLAGFANRYGYLAPFLLAGGALAAPLLAGAGAGAAGGAAGAAGAGAAGAGAAAASTMPAWLTAAGKGAAIGAGMGGGSAALTGGNVGQGILRGGITGAVGGGMGSAMGGGYAGNMAGGALAGGTGAALRGGNILEGAGMGAAGGALSAGISGLDAPDAVKTGLNMFGKPIVMSQLRNALGGEQGNGELTGQNSGLPGNLADAYQSFDPGIPTRGLPTLSSYEKTPWANLMPQIVLSKLSEFAPEREMAAGGVTGIGHLGGYSDGGRLLKGPGDGMSDNIPATISDKQPARLADGEFVIPADVVSHLGNGSTDAGAKQLYLMMDKIRKARTGNEKQGKQINPSKFLPKG
jgi:hypothetical protein